MFTGKICDVRWGTGIYLGSIQRLQEQKLLFMSWGIPDNISKDAKVVGRLEYHHN